MTWTDADRHHLSHSSSLISLPQPPATFYGEVPAFQDLVPIPGMPVRAWVNDVLCGQSLIQAVGNQIVYVVHVTADIGDGCGVPGRVVNFEIGDRMMDVSAVWTNESLHELSLIASKGEQIFFPIVTCC